MSGKTSLNLAKVNAVSVKNNNWTASRYSQSKIKGTNQYNYEKHNIDAKFGKYEDKFEIGTFNEEDKDKKNPIITGKTKIQIGGVGASKIKNLQKTRNMEYYQGRKVAYAKAADNANNWATKAYFKHKSRKAEKKADNPGFITRGLDKIVNKLRTAEKNNSSKLDDDYSGSVSSSKKKIASKVANFNKKAADKANNKWKLTQNVASKIDDKIHNGRNVKTKSSRGKFKFNEPRTFQKQYDSNGDPILDKNGNHVYKETTGGNNEYKGPGSKLKYGNTTLAKASVSAEANLLQAKGKIGDDNNGASAEIDLLHAEASATAEIGPDHARASVSAEASLVHAEAEGHLGNEYVGAKGSVTADVGHVYGEASAAIGYYRGEDGKMHLDAGVKAECGAELCSATASGSVRVGGVEMGGTAKVKVGVGAQFECGIQDGKFNFKIGASLGIGFELGFSLDFSGVGEFCQKVYEDCPVVKAVVDSPIMFWNWGW